MTIEEKMREEFEAWEIEEGLTDPMWFEPGWFDEKNQEYRLDKVNFDWSIWKAAWKASRESLVIDLPPAPVPRRRDGTYTIAQSAYHQGQISVEKYIHAAGVKTK